MKFSIDEPVRIGCFDKRKEVALIFLVGHVKVAWDGTSHISMPRLSRSTRKKFQSRRSLPQIFSDRIFTVAFLDNHNPPWALKILIRSKINSSDESRLSKLRSSRKIPNAVGYKTWTFKKTMEHIDRMSGS